MFDASLHNKKMKPRPEGLKITKKEREEFDKHAMDLQARMKKRYEDGNK